jgi:spore maturation protein CgeB
MRIAFFGSSLVSAYWNGAATYYRGLLKALSDRGHRITFYEPDAFERQQHRDMPDPDWARVVVYPGDDVDAAARAVDAAHAADLVVKASGVGVYDSFLEEAVLGLRSPRRSVAFWDVDAPATLERVQTDPTDPFLKCIPQYDLIFTYGGGAPVVSAYESLGAKRCTPIYNALDPATHFPVVPRPELKAELSFLGNRLPDREQRVHEFFFEAARQLPDRQFLLGGSGWNPGEPHAPNVRLLGHVYTRDHNALNCSAKAVLNIARDSMARCGFSPATRVFEAAGAGACIITDNWTGIDCFFEPDSEILIAESGDEVAQLLQETSPAEAHAIGAAALRRVLAEHTYAHRAAEVEGVLRGSPTYKHSITASP